MALTEGNFLLLQPCDTTATLTEVSLFNKLTHVWQIKNFRLLVRTVDSNEFASQFNPELVWTLTLEPAFHRPNVRLKVNLIDTRDEPQEVESKITVGVIKPNGTRCNQKTMCFTFGTSKDSFFQSSYSTSAVFSLIEKVEEEDEKDKLNELCGPGDTLTLFCDIITNNPENGEAIRRFQARPQDLICTNLGGDSEEKPTGGDVHYKTIDGATSL